MLFTQVCLPNEDRTLCHAHPAATSHLRYTQPLISTVHSAFSLQDFYKPHPLVETSLYGVLILLKLPATLLEAQTTLQATDFKSRLLEFDTGSLDDAALHRLKRTLNKPLLSVEVCRLVMLPSCQAPFQANGPWTYWDCEHASASIKPHHPASCTAYPAHQAAASSLAMPPENTA